MTSNVNDKSPQKVIEFVRNFETGLEFGMTELLAMLYNAGIKASSSRAISSTTAQCALKYCVEQGDIVRVHKRLYRKLDPTPKPPSIEDLILHLPVGFVGNEFRLVEEQLKRIESKLECLLQGRGGVE